MIPHVMINIFCEGKTEQLFCKNVLQPHLFPAGEGQILTLAVGVKDDHHIYGLGKKKKYQEVRKFILNTIRQRQGENVYFSTLLDLYALPHDFPGTRLLSKNPSDPTPYVLALESAFQQDINYFRFVPNLVLHEFETVLFADPEKFRGHFDKCEEEIQSLKQIVDRYKSIEHINDGDTTAPSKRIIKIFPEYDGRKSTLGSDIAAAIGLPAIRKSCPDFHTWLDQLENIALGRG